MSNKLYVGNLSYSVTDNDLQDLFAQFGPVSEVKIMMDRVTGRPRGFAFVTMASDEGAQAAVQALDNKEWEGRVLKVNEARPREEQPQQRSGGSRDRGRESRY